MMKHSLHLLLEKEMEIKIQALIKWKKSLEKYFLVQGQIEKLQNKIIIDYAK